MKEDSVSLIQRLGSSGIGKRVVPDPVAKGNGKGYGITRAKSSKSSAVSREKRQQELVADMIRRSSFYIISIESVLFCTFVAIAVIVYLVSDKADTGPVTMRITVSSTWLSTS